MVKERITDKEAICLISIFILGSSVILGIGTNARNDAWLTGIFGLIAALPILLLYVRILRLYPGQDLFEILIAVWGKIIGRVASVLYIVYFFHLGALVLRNFSEFIKTVSLVETPIMVIILFTCIVAIAGARSGIEVLARLSTIILPAILVVFFTMQCLALPIMHFDNILPILGEGLGPVIDGGFSSFSFPFAELVVFLGVLYALKDKKSPLKVYYFGAGLGGAVIIIQTLVNLFILGNAIDNFYFPSYVAISRIQLGDLFQRMEGTMAITFLCGAFIKTTICLFSTCKGIARFFNLENYKYVVIQSGMLMALFSYTVYDNIVEMQFWAFEIYKWYALPFQVFIPILIWVSAEIKNRKRKKEK